jgi:hypothetical protein
MLERVPLPSLEWLPCRKLTSSGSPELFEQINSCRTIAEHDNAPPHRKEARLPPHRVESWAREIPTLLAWNQSQCAQWLTLPPQRLLFWILPVQDDRNSPLSLAPQGSPFQVPSDTLIHRSSLHFGTLQPPVALKPTNLPCTHCTADPGLAAQPSQSESLPANGHSPISTAWGGLCAWYSLRP